LIWITDAVAGLARAQIEISGARVRILFFGKLGDMVGREVHIEVSSDGCTVAKLRELLAQLHPHADEDLRRPSLRACVDDIVVGEQFLVDSTVAVEFLPPLSGG
jgi:molybdopterin synthase sulfur carrier subunit